jgi:hypothetical protein
MDMLQGSIVFRDDSRAAHAVMPLQKCPDVSSNNKKTTERAYIFFICYLLLLSPVVASLILLGNLWLLLALVIMQ